MSDIVQVIDRAVNILEEAAGYPDYLPSVARGRETIDHDLARLRELRDAIERDRKARTAWDATRKEVEALRQGLWDCFRVAGGDTDGDPTPRAITSPLVPLVLDCVKDLRDGYDELLGGLPLTPPAPHP